MVDTQGTGAPGLVIAGSASGTGKTTLATGLMAALSRRHIVAPFKVGPDYIDPGYHGVATGRPGRNLDSVMCGTGRIAPLYRHGSRGADIAVVAFRPCPRTSAMRVLAPPRVAQLPVVQWPAAPRLK